MKKSLIILGIETSCDETAASVLKVENVSGQPSGYKLKILSNVVASQVKLHAKYGGVYPMLAKREHQRNLPIVFNKALRKAGFAISNFQFSNSKQNPKSKIQIPKIDLIAVTVGPGLEPCLWVSVNFAKNLAERLKVPIIPVNHIEAHILVNFVGLNSKFKIQNLFPAIALVVSGGHTQLILMKGPPAGRGTYKILGETRDDAAGECFDKTARILGLGYPGGPTIAVNAAQNQNSKVKIQNYNSKFKISLPRPMINQKNYDFSFSGLKTAVLYKVKELQNSSMVRTIELNKRFVQEMCFEVQQAVIDVLIKKTLKAVRDYKAKTIILGGGVAANEELQKQFKSEIRNLKLKINFFAPEKILCTDNAAMIAIAGYFHQFQKTKNYRKIKADANLRL